MGGAAHILQSEREALRSPRSIGERLMLTRNVFGMTQTEFGKGAGIKKSTYNQYENGKERPSLDEAIKLCEKYGLTLDWIYRGDTRGLGPDLCAAIEAMQRTRSRSAVSRTPTPVRGDGPEFYDKRGFAPNAFNGMNR